MGIPSGAGTDLGDVGIRRGNYCHSTRTIFSFRVTGMNCGYRGPTATRRACRSPSGRWGCGAGLGYCHSTRTAVSFRWMRLAGSAGGLLPLDAHGLLLLVDGMGCGYRGPTATRRACRSPSGWMRMAGLPGATATRRACRSPSGRWGCGPGLGYCHSTRTAVSFRWMRLAGSCGTTATRRASRSPSGSMRMAGLTGSTATRRARSAPSGRRDGLTVLGGYCHSTRMAISSGSMRMAGLRALLPLDAHVGLLLVAGAAGLAWVTATRRACRSPSARSGRWL